MMLIFVLLVFVFSSSVYSDIDVDVDRCGNEGFTPYKDEKCIKVFNKKVGSFSKIREFCENKDPEKKTRMLTIITAEEQAFVTDYLFNESTNISTDIWLGARYDEEAKDFVWQASLGSSPNVLDELGRSSNYSNWLERRLTGKNLSNANSFVEMIASGKAKENGKWRVTTNSSKANLAVCEHPQLWSVSKLQAELLKVQRENKAELLKIHIQNKNEIKNIFPVGFIYVQLPKQESPKELWPRLNWKDVSDQYDSTFFRVAGSKAASFGDFQEEFSPYIDEIEYNFCSEDCDIKRSKFPRKGGWTGKFLVSDYFTPGGGNHYFDYLNFHIDSGEVRPRNMAIKVWKRMLTL